MISRLFFLLMLTVFTPLSNADSVTHFKSSTTQTQLLELYTSQGCSSCPPAEKWLNQYLTKPYLWQQVIPINFHVDYWDSLGWPDPYASSVFTQRQRIYKALGNTHVVATPGFVINGQGWNGWFYGKPLPILRPKEVGTLGLIIDNANVNASFTPSSLNNKKLILNIARIGFDLKNAIHRGENAGKVLKHDFVALSFQKIPFQQSNISYVLSGTLDKAIAKSEMQGVVAWVTRENNPTPIQSVGGFLN